jgi:hypothetical protein
MCLDFWGGVRWMCDEKSCIVDEYIGSSRVALLAVRLALPYVSR